LAINQFTSVLDKENMRFEVLIKNLTKLETALHIAKRYEAFKPEHLAPTGDAHQCRVTKGGDAARRATTSGVKHTTYRTPLRHSGNRVLSAAAINEQFVGWKIYQGEGELIQVQE